MDAKHDDCTQRERLVTIEKEITEIKTTNHYHNQELQEVKEALRECTKAINALREDISSNKGSNEALRWIIPVGVTIVVFIVTKFI